MTTSEDPLDEEWEFWRRELRQFVDGLTRSPCSLPPEGWTCSRGAGHEGPCAARPMEDNPAIRKLGMVMPISDELLHDNQLRPCDIKDCPHCPVPTPKEPVSRRTRLRWWCGQKWRHLRLRAALFLAGDLVVDLDEVDDWR